ncbi:glycosyltransferase [Nannocystis pusilla]|uniref:glycosyltransferase n=1 Tax=Nannocystis pusilla TaxID=889268 RepID=UPI003B7D1DF1
MIGRADDFRVKGFHLAGRALGSLQRARRPIVVLRGLDLTDGAKIQQDLKRAIGGNYPDIRFRGMTGDEAEIDRDLRESALLLMPSVEEGFGLVALEAISAGTPVLVTRNSGVAEMLEEFVPNEASAIVVPSLSTESANVEAWRSAIEANILDRNTLQAAFTRASAIRDSLRPSLVWKDAVAALLAAVPGTRRLITAAVPDPVVESAASIGATAHVFGLLDFSSADQLTQMLSTFVENVLSEQQRVAAREEALAAAEAQLDAARKHDEALLIQLRVAKHALCAKYTALKLDLGTMADSARQARDKAAVNVLRIADLVGRDLQAIPNNVQAYAQRHFRYPHSDVDHSTWIVANALRWAAERQDPIDNYALENAQRLREQGPACSRLTSRTTGAVISTTARACGRSPLKRT